MKWVFNAVGQCFSGWLGNSRYPVLITKRLGRHTIWVTRIKISKRPKMGTNNNDQRRSHIFAIHTDLLEMRTRRVLNRWKFPRVTAINILSKCFVLAVVDRLGFTWEKDTEQVVQTLVQINATLFEGPARREAVKPMVSREHPFSWCPTIVSISIFLSLSRSFYLFSSAYRHAKNDRYVETYERQQDLTMILLGIHKEIFKRHGNNERKKTKSRLYSSALTECVVHRRLGQRHDRVHSQAIVKEYTAW